MLTVGIVTTGPLKTFTDPSNSITGQNSTMHAKSLWSSHLRISGLDPLGTFHLRAKPALSFEHPKTSGIKAAISKSSYSRHMYCYLFLLLQILMSSSSGSNVIRIHTASYGRRDKTTCSSGCPANQLSKTDCSASTTLPIVKKR